MNKNFYTVFFASDRNQYSNSIQISKTGVLLLLLFGIIMIGLALIGITRIFNQDELTKELESLRKTNILLQDMIGDVEYINNLDSLVPYEVFVSDVYSKHPISYPNKAPIEGYVTRRLNLEENHYGIDIAAKFQDEIKAPSNGRVIFSGMSDVLGNTIIINHAAGFVTVYAHNDTNLVIAGTAIEKGQSIALIGETGNSKGPHLHFEIWKNNHVLDPQEIIPIYKTKDVSIR